MSMKEPKQGSLWDFHSDLMRKAIPFIFILFAACAVTKDTGLSNDRLLIMQQKVPDMTMETAKAGYSLYLKKCATCHRLYKPEEFKEAKWELILVKMFPKARIHDLNDKKLIENYLISLSKSNTN